MSATSPSIGKIDLIHDVQYINVDDLKTDGVNPNYVEDEIQKAMTAHIKQGKFYGAILVNKNNWVVDGKHRLAVLKDMGVKKIPCIVGDWNEQESKIEMLRFNRERGVITPYETGLLLQELKSDFNMTDNDIMEQTELSQNDMNMMVGLLPAFEEQETLADINENVQVVGWSEVDKMVTVVCNKIKQQYDTVYTVSRGGLVPARLIADKLGIQYISTDKEPPDGALFVDDCWDSGKTCSDYSQCVRVVLYAKQGVPEDIIYGADFSKFLIFPWDKYEHKDKKMS